MTKRATNFNAGPSAIPLPALEYAQKEFLDFEGSGMSVMEHSHRGKLYEAAHNEAIALLRELMSIPENYDVLFMQGGARAQFALLPMNLISEGQSADYVVTGSWSEQAIKEANRVAKARAAASSEDNGVYRRIPKQSELDLDASARYLHITSNNTIFGTQFQSFPDAGTTPLIADMSSDILSRPIDVSKFGVIYAGAQKNLGPSGVTLVIIRKDLVENGRTDIAQIFQYGAHAKANSLLNTPPTFAIYMLRNVLRWIKELGGVKALDKRNREKAKLLYDTIEKHDGFYRNTIEADSRSLMNVVFNLPNEELEKKFVAEATEANMIGLKGHRSVGGIRASIYNAVSIENVQTLCAFMNAFAKR
ncbi:MAG: 3-phosphoserine/phosphohydroxythreonine transaminase [Myxococcales bacterium]|nr:MAG: 3-phosphoserine/phosphohydroxythreonine transaminase [Myxococcales bacterium]